MADKPAMILVAGFGDGPAMFEPLLHTRLAAKYRLIPVALPGFCGEPPLAETNLTTLAAYVNEVAIREGARLAVGHSVASVIVSLAALRHPWPIDVVLSLEGNLTAKDGYFSATAADYTEPAAFLDAFMTRLAPMAAKDEILKRYRECVADADPTALWRLGCDAAAFSRRFVPGEVLAAVSRVWYFYNPDNCDADSVRWLETRNLPRTILPGVSHWPSLDAPDQLAEAMLAAIQSLTAEE